ncbi:MAG: stage II sporulation protein M [Nanoarchaeota archaeon]
MVLESLIRSSSAEEHPFRMVMLGALYILLSLVISLWVFRSYASLVTVFFAVIFLIPLYFDTLLREEYKEIHTQSERRLLFEHAHAVQYLIWIFVGMTSAFAFSYIVIPSEYVNDAFGVQEQTITDFNDELSMQLTGDVITREILPIIFWNNLKVLLLSFFLSFVSGSGVLFIIAWNASVIGVALGTFIVEEAAKISAGAVLLAPLLGLLRYALHGIPEVIAYLIAGIAGGLLSLAVIHHNAQHANAKKMFLDVGSLLLISIVILMIAGLIEVFIPSLLGL